MVRRASAIYAAKSSRKGVVVVFSSFYRLSLLDFKKEKTIALCLSSSKF